MPPVLLARHAQTTANVERWISGWRTDVDLTTVGIERARELGRRLAHAVGTGAAVAPVAILTSDLTRASHTANLINEALALPVHEHPGLRERNYGEWTGRPYADLGNDPKAWQDIQGDPNRPLWTHEQWAPPGGESLIELRRRAVAALHDGIVRWDAHPFLVVCHRGTLRALLMHLHQLAYTDTPSPPDPPDWLAVEWPEGGK